MKVKPSCKSAGGYAICDGCPAYPNLRRGQRKPWIKIVRSFILRRIKSGDPEIIRMVQDAEAEWLTFEPRPFNSWPSLTPLEKCQMLIAHILRQGRFTAVDILAAGIGTDLIISFGQPPLKTPYYRAAQIGHAVRALLKAEFRVYEREDMATGEIISTRVCLTAKARLRSRNAAQRIEKAVKKHGQWFIERYGAELAGKVLR